MRKEVVVNVKDMLMRIVLKWRSIIVCAIVGMLLLDGVGIYKSHKEVKAAKEMQKIAQKGGKISYDDVTASLNEAEKKDAECRFNAYKIYLNKYKSYVDYSNKSILMNLDPNKVYQHKFVYKVSQPQEKNDVETTLKSFLSDNDIYESFVKDYKFEDSKEYVSELVRVGDKTSKMSKNDKVEVNVANDNSKVIQITVTASNDKQVEDLAKIVEDKIENNANLIKSQNDGVTLTKVTDRLIKTSDNEILEQQSNVALKMDKINTSIVNNLNNLDELSREYYKAMVKNLSLDEKDNLVYIDTTDGTISTGNTKNKKVEVEVPSLQLVNKKLVVLGAALGIFLSLIVLALRYLLDKTLKNETEVRDSFGISVLGVVSVNDKKVSKLDQKIMGLFGRKVLPQQEVLKNINHKCVALTKAKCLSSIIFINDNENVKMQEIISKNLFKDVEVKFMNSNEFIEEVATSKNPLNVVVTEEVSKTSYVDIDEQLELFEQLGVNVIGSIVLE
ncbi:hypothetical protein [Lachnobacterium bovis]|uniref:hypothetical protein n=1 Tax=Lachnobacterium bovis TaxID=140626 RepID=UPI000489A95F|nr:hypothetical protein [Lachnobacterium bovis]